MPNEEHKAKARELLDEIKHWMIPLDPYDRRVILDDLAEAIAQAFKAGRLSGQAAAFGAVHNALYPRISEPDTDKICAAVVALVERLESGRASAAEWVATSERMPTREDANEKELVFALLLGTPTAMHYAFAEDVPADDISFPSHWMRIPALPAPERGGRG